MLEFEPITAVFSMGKCHSYICMLLHVLHNTAYTE